MTMSTNNIHPTAIIAEEAKLGENITVGPYSIIGPEVVIGNGTTVESHVVIEGETIIGENNYIFSFASFTEKSPKQSDAFDTIFC